ncbi:class I SAM-dependent methyltransferase [Candidatus Peregrinibacteria bacterium]|nr:class I SAM-dependent methyltransferase [Candidatus Peregrinibacteria bacterium]
MTANINGDVSGFDLHFSLNSLNTLNATEDRHFWSVVKQRLIASLIKHYKPKKPLRIIDVGCGNGSLLRQLERAFPTAVLAGIDGYAQALSHCRKRSMHATLIQEDILHLERLPASEPFDVAILADVLEHCDEPERVLLGVRSILAKDGIVIATVPASMLLWSDRDVFLGHRKRYNRSEFEALFRESGFQVLRSNYAFCYLYPPTLFFRRVWSRWHKKEGKAIEETELREIPILNVILRWLGLAEITLSLYAPLPFGTSTYCVARLT